jgi:membrane protease subunit (stomatin/prohibitin family)
MQWSPKSLVSAIAGAFFLIVLAGGLTAIPKSAQAGKGGAFLGGLIGGHVLTNMANRSERRTEAAEYQAYSQQPAQAAPAPAAQSSGSSVQDRLDTLDKLAANGTITKEEYQKRRQAIIDGI